MRIVAGTHRGRALETPTGDAIRPTADRVREALFSILGHRLGGFGGKSVLDGFAGTGALGLEALSRGAASVTFIERDRAALDLCRRNVALLKEVERARLILGDVTRPPRATAPCDLVLLDPPYGQGKGAAALIALHETGWLAPSTLAVVEADRSQPETLPPGFTLLDTRDYGRTRIQLLAIG